MLDARVTEEKKCKEINIGVPNDKFPTFSIRSLNVGLINLSQKMSQVEGESTWVFSEDLLEF